MTDKILKPIHTIRKVSLQQNPHLSNDYSKITPDFLLANDSLLSIKNKYELVPQQDLCKSPRHDILLKPSLKLHRNTPTNKSVRFNMPLVQVLHFHSHGVEEEYEEEDDEEEEEDDDEDDYYVEEEESDLEDAFLEIFSRGLSSPHDTESHLFPHYLTDPFNDSLALKLTNWPSVHAKQRSLSQMVSLESLDWENARSVIKGCVLVHNVAFKKSVMVRMSFNHWQTWIDVEATYKESLNDALDRFSFELVTPNHLSYLNLINTSSSCSMAIRYQVNGQEYWDNNNQCDFNVQWVSCASTGAGASAGVAAGAGAGFTSSAASAGADAVTDAGTGAATAAGGNKIIKRKDVVIKQNPISFYPAYNQELEIKKEEYSTCFLARTYIAPSCNDKSSYLSTQQQISAHFQSYLNDRHRQPKYSVQDHHAIMSVPSPRPPPLLIPPSRNNLVLT
ncbi:hypothetical protein HPULCUR_008117 [Helicostylum pulchrum]|uniref:CBM21 domain-containing protein n=1 Tax=Helicostylum pulchrum TaxID=562976 RepID=A0ABP9Y6P1_9FUNG